MKRKKLLVHNYEKTCGRCMCSIYEDEQFIIVKSHHGLTREYFHDDQQLCIEAMRREDAIVNVR